MDAWNSVRTILDHMGPEMCQTWPSGQPPASVIDNRTDLIKATLILNIKLMLGVQSGPSRTMCGPEMAQAWPSGPFPASDIDFRTNFMKATLMPKMKFMKQCDFSEIRPKIDI